MLSRARKLQLTGQGWNVSVRPERGPRTTSTNSGNPYIDSHQRVGEQSYRRYRKEEKELHFKKAELGLKKQMFQLQQKNGDILGSSSATLDPVGHTSVSSGQESLDPERQRLKEMFLNAKLEEILRGQLQDDQRASASKPFYVGTFSNSGVSASNSLRKLEQDRFYDKMEIQ